MEKNNPKINTKIKTETVFLTEPSQTTKPYPVEPNNFKVKPNRGVEITESDFNDSIQVPQEISRSAFRVPIERQIKYERDSFESDCAVGSQTATNETLFSSEDLKENIVQFTDNNIYIHKDPNFVSVKTEAQDDEVFPCSGNCFENSQPDPAMADPFFEEFLDLNNLFPDLIPGVDNDDCQPLPQLPTGLILPKEELPVPPITDFMNELDSILAETEVDNSNSMTIDELLNIEVVEEAPLMTEQNESFSSSVSSPGSVVSLDSCSTSNYTGTYAESTASDTINADLQHLLDLLNTNPANTITVDTKEIFPETSNGKTCKRKHSNEEEEEPVVKRPKSAQSTNERTTDKTTQRRIKNNAASRICRATRKEKEEELFKKEEELTKSNKELRAQLEELTKETETLRNVLIQRLTNGCN